MAPISWHTSPWKLVRVNLLSSTQNDMPSLKAAKTYKKMHKNYIMLECTLACQKKFKIRKWQKKMYCIVIILISGTYMYCLYIWCHPCVVKEFLPLQRLVFSWFLISIYVGIIASLEPLYEAVFRVYYPFPNCCSLSLDCSWYSKGAISSNINWWVYSTLPYISHGSKENIFGAYFLYSLRK